MVRIINFAAALWKESVKRLPYVLALFVVLSLASYYLQFRKISEAVRVEKENSIAIKRAVDDFEQDNHNQTTIICRLIQKGAFNSQQLTDSEVAQVEKICKEAIARGAEAPAKSVVNSGSTSSAAPPKVQQAPAPTPQSQPKSPTPPSSSSHSSPPGSPSAPSQPPGLIKQVINFLGL